MNVAHSLDPEGSVTPTCPPARLNYRRLAEDWALSPAVVSNGTASQHNVLMVLARRCNASVGYEPRAHTLLIFQLAHAQGVCRDTHAARHVA